MVADVVVTNVRQPAVVGIATVQAVTAALEICLAPSVSPGVDPPAGGLSALYTLGRGKGSVFCGSPPWADIRTRARQAVL